MASESAIESAGAEKFLNTFERKGDIYTTSKTSFNVSFDVLAEEIKKVVDDGGAVDQRIYPWTIENNTLTVKVGEEARGIIETEVPISDFKSPSSDPITIKTGYAFGIDNLFGNISGKVKIFLASGIGICPMIIEQKTETYTLKALLAPVEV